ncbi:MAG: hypothetical protein AAB709_01525 [Patescibacteria group bacterium]
MDTKPPQSTDQNGEIPEKYIRTFEGDMMTFKKGITPNLSPLENSHPAPEERLIASSPRIATQNEMVDPVPEPPIEPVPVLKAESRPTPLKTYAGDFKEHMKESDASPATVLAAEQDARPRFFQAMPEQSRESRWPIVAGIILLIIGGIGAYVAYVRYLTALAPVVVTSTILTPIFIDSSESLSGTGAELAQAIKQSVGKPLAANTVRLLTLDGVTAGDTNVFAALDTRAPGGLLRNMNAGGNMAGIVKTSAGQSPFFILSVGSYSITFSNMLSWESTMQNDLRILFPAPAESAVAQISVSTTSPVTASSTPNTKIGFRDEVVSNHDVRMYRDSTGRSIVLYGYWDQTTLVIARDSSAFAEILARLATSNTR